MNTKPTTKSLKWICYLAIVILLASTNGVAHSSNGSGYALDLDGADDYVDFGTSNIFDFGTGDFSIELWVKYASLSGEQVLIEKWNGTDGPGWTFTKMSYNDFRFGTSSDYLDGTPPSITTNTWYHIAAVRNTGTLTFYWNGTAMASGASSGSASGGANLFLGRRNSFQGFFMNGLFDEVRIWNVARTPAQIQANMHKPLVGNETGLVGYWRVDDGSGSTVNDSTSNNNDGTLVNMDPPTDWVSSTAPIGNLTAGTSNVAAMWAAQTSTVSDGFATGLDISNVSFLNATGDDIVFGHNNATFANVTTHLPVGVDKRWARVWELVVTDLGTTGGNVDLTFDISDAGGNSGNPFSNSGTYYLLKRATGSSNTFTTDPVVSPSVSGDQLTFQVSVGNLGSEFTIGATFGSPSGEYRIYLPLIIR
jgi:hypothetical protein